MTRLIDIDFTANDFSRFPIELYTMSWLQRLNLKSNKMTLLPRNIHLMSFLQRLDLSGNKLRALPVEFVEVFESVPDVNLLDNPWTALPPRWISLWQGDKDGKGNASGVSRAERAPNGVTVTEAVHFLYGMRDVRRQV